MNVRRKAKVSRRLPKADSIFRGRYYTSGRGRQTVRKYKAKGGVVELTTANVNGKKWYELGVRNHGWEQRKWFYAEYESKSEAEKNAFKAIKIMPKLKGSDETVDFDSLRSELK